MDIPINHITIYGDTNYEYFNLNQINIVKNTIDENVLTMLKKNINISNQKLYITKKINSYNYSYINFLNIELDSIDNIIKLFENNVILSDDIYFLFDYIKDVKSNNKNKWKNVLKIFEYLDKNLLLQSYHKFKYIGCYYENIYALIYKRIEIDYPNIEINDLDENLIEFIRQLMILGFDEIKYIDEFINLVNKIGKPFKYKFID